MVWIHGGAFTYGESDDFDPSALARKGVIVVTLNYRLGALGFLADPALAGTPGGATGNYGLMDQQAALRWVRSGIGRFGGDPGKVTIFGQSAGGLSVLSHLVSPGSRGLFQRAIVQSGTYNLGMQTRDDAEAAGKAFAASVGCAGQGAACLRAVPVATVLAKENKLGYVPDVDGRVITEAPRTALADGRFAHVPVVIGTTHDEWRLQLGVALLTGSPQVTAANYTSWIAVALHVSAQAAAVIAARYPVSAYPSPDIALATAVTDGGYSCSMLSAADALARYVPVHAYEFNDENAPERYLPPLGFPYGAAHLSELQYLFDLTAPIPGTLSPAQQRLAAAMRTGWTGLARRGVPPRWPAFDPARRRVLSLAPPLPRTETTFAVDHQCAFWASPPR
jgi:para-nitrobenzyl esterase